MCKGERNIDTAAAM